MKTLQQEEICELPEKHGQVLDKQAYGNPNREGCFVLLSSLHKQYQPATLVVFTSSSLETWYDIHCVTEDCTTQSSLRDSNEETEVHWKMLGSLHSSDGQGELWTCVIRDCDDSMIYDQCGWSGYYALLCYKNTQRNTHRPLHKPVSSEPLGDTVI